MNTTTDTTTDIAQDIKYLVEELNFFVEQGRQASDDIAEKMSRGGYRVGSMWGLGFYDIALGHRAAEVLRGLELDESTDFLSDVVARIGVVNERLTERLVSGSFDPNSSSDLARGFDAVEREAARKLNSTLGSFVRRTS
jgi:hypothetical protein